MSSARELFLLDIIAGAEAIRLSPVLALISKDELVANSKYSKSISFDISSETVGDPLTGLISFVQMFSYVEAGGTGAVKKPVGTLYALKSDPAVAVNASALAANGADHLNIIGNIPIAATDWESDANGAVLNVLTDIPFRDLTNVFFVFQLDTGSAYNSSAGDDERLDICFGSKASRASV